MPQFIFILKNSWLPLLSLLHWTILNCHCCRLKKKGWIVAISKGVEPPNNCRFFHWWVDIQHVLFIRGQMTRGKPITLSVGCWHLIQTLSFVIWWSMCWSVFCQGDLDEKVKLLKVQGYMLCSTTNDLLSGWHYTTGNEPSEINQMCSKGRKLLF